MMDERTIIDGRLYFRWTYLRPESYRGSQGKDPEKFMVLYCPNLEDELKLGQVSDVELRQGIWRTYQRVKVVQIDSEPVPFDADTYRHWVVCEILDELRFED